MHSQNDKKNTSHSHPTSKAEKTKQHLDLSDKDFVRVLDDLIEILIAKNIIQYTDFPEKAQEKLNRRNKLRQSLNTLQNFINEQDEELNL